MVGGLVGGRGSGHGRCRFGSSGDVSWLVLKLVLVVLVVDSSPGRA